MLPLLIDAIPSGHADTDRMLNEALHTARSVLRMQVAFIAEFEGGRRIFRHVDTDPEFMPIRPGDSDPLEESYCQRVADGRLPELIPDATRNAEALRLPATLAMPVGAHLSVPIRFSDGHVYGTFCCFSRVPDASLNDRDIGLMRIFADFVGRLLERMTREQAERSAMRAQFQDVLDHGRYGVVYQPIVDVTTGRTGGYESLARFHTEPPRAPDAWFAEAARAGMGVELEMALLHRGLQGLQALPDTVYLSLNVSPATILAGDIAGALQGWPLPRIVLEVTEHTEIEDYAQLLAVLAPLRKAGVRLAIDDAGAGFASFRHVLKLHPELIKLDRSLTHRVDSDPSSRALAAALVRFAEETGSGVVAEGVETETELLTLRELGVSLVQGYLLGRPAALETWLADSRVAAAPVRR